MKKFAIILIVAFIAIMVISSCNKQSCPAYGKADVKTSVHIS